MKKPVVAIVGRANVGKSTLFNRITGGRTSIVEDTPGITRDRVYRDADWAGVNFTVVDTGGLEIRARDDYIGNQVRRHAQIAAEEADLIIFLVDARTGITQEDEIAAKALLRSPKSVILAANKVDNLSQAALTYEFYKLGFGEPIAISAEHGMNVGDLLDRVISSFKDMEMQEEYEGDAFKVAIVGRPNVGKSSLLNSLTGEERVIVSDIPGTTRDAVDTLFKLDEQDYLFIDTAGIRRKSKITDSTERYSVSRALKAIQRSDVVLMVVDAVEGVAEQDKRIAGYAHEAGKAIIVVVNKWDLVVKEGDTMNLYDTYIRQTLAFMKYAPVVYVSALTNRGVHKLFELIDFVVVQASQRVSTRRLNDVFRESVMRHPPPTKKGKRLNVYYITQVKVRPPTFMVFMNDVKLFHFAYRRYLENRIREEFGFEGTPIRLVARKRD
ncbi:MAG: ribosome biogenesis GTPase Der [Clostridia bacterium]|nr:ribosome biogenesis GTPase Der [Clostridia bacterium]